MTKEEKKHPEQVLARLLWRGETRTAASRNRAVHELLQWLEVQRKDAEHGVNHAITAKEHEEFEIELEVVEALQFVVRAYRDLKKVPV